MFRRTLQPLFRFDHLAAGKPVIVAPVLAKRDQIGRRANGAHGAVELLFAVRVAMHEHRHIAPRGCRLMMSDRVQRDTRFCDHTVAVALRDLAVILNPLGLKPALNRTIRPRRR